jgi:sterol 14-demethylase
MLSTPPCAPGGLPLIGHLLPFQQNRAQFLASEYERFASIFSFRLGPKKVAVFIGTEAQELFFTKTDTALRMDKAYGFLRAIFGDVAFVANPETYVAERHVLHAPFRGKKMPGYVDVMRHEVQHWLDGLGDTGEFELIREMTRLTQYVAGHALMGKEFCEAVGDEFWALYAVLARSLDPVLPPHWPLPKFRRRDRAFKQMQAILTPIIEERRPNPSKHQDFLQDFVEAKYKDGTALTIDKITRYILALNFAGHETTSGQASWAVIELLRHPEYQRLVQAEIEEYLPAGEPVDLAALGRLKYTEWAVRETERLWPVTDMLLRYVEEEVEVGGYRVPAGWLAMVVPPLAHRLPELFTNPHVYDPMRFGPDRAEHNKHRFSMITFGGGVHKCTGMNFAYNEMMMVIVMLFQQFDLELMTPDPQAVYGMGASQPEPTRIRYRRKRRIVAVGMNELPGQSEQGCPHLRAIPQG